MATYFISDAHLGLGSPEQEKRKEDNLLSFLRAILPDADELFIVGDLFDFWFEYETVIPKGYHRTLAILHEFTEQGKSIQYLVGNHDCWMGDFFEKELGMTIHHEPLETSVQGKRLLVHHGDGLSNNDLGYKMIKPVLRNRFNIWMYRWLHPDIGVRLARGSSRTSREYTSNKDFGEEEGMIEFATREIERGVDIVVMGHRHVPHIRSIGKGTYVNLGDWISHFTFGKLDEGVIQLLAWDGKQVKQHV